MNDHLINMTKFTIQTKKQWHILARVCSFSKNTNPKSMIQLCVFEVFGDNEAHKNRQTEKRWGRMEKLKLLVVDTKRAFVERI